MRFLSLQPFSGLPMVSITFWFNVYSIIFVKGVSGLGNFVFNYFSPVYDSAFNWNNELKKIIEYTISVVLNHKCIFDSSTGFKIDFSAPYSEILTAHIWGK